MNLTKCVLMFQIGLASSLSALAQQGSLKGVISDSEGAVVPRAQVLVHADAAGRKSPPPRDVSVIADKVGQFEVTLKPGFYDVCVMADAFTPDCRKVFVSSKKTLAHTVHLKIDPQVTESLGDKFD